MSMLTRDDRIKDRTLRAVQLKDAESKSAEIIQRLMAQYEGKHTELINRLKELQEQRKVLLESPLTKDEFLAIAKTRVDSAKKAFIEYYVKPHLAECYTGNIPPLPDNRIKLLCERELSYLPVFTITDDVLKEVVDSLPIPKNAISTKERKSKLGEIEDEINVLITMLNDELDEINK